MAAKLPAIPAIQVSDNATRSILVPLKEIVEILTGQRRGRETDRYVTAEEFANKPTWQDLSLVNGWTNYGSGYANASFYLDAFGVVHLRGVIKSGSVPSVVMVLPHKPSFRTSLSVITNTGVGQVDVLSNGEVTVMSGGSTFVGLDGISFRT